MASTITFENGQVVIRLDVNGQPTLKEGGKMLMLDSTHGFTSVQTPHGFCRVSAMVGLSQEQGTVWRAKPDAAPAPTLVKRA